MLKTKIEVTTNEFEKTNELKNDATDITIESQLEVFAELLIDNFLKQINEKKQD
jgi:hypothetical protein